MAVKKTLELEFLDKNDKVLKFSIQNPKNNIEKPELTKLEQSIVDNKFFKGATGDIKGFGKAYIKEINTRDLLK